MTTDPTKRFSSRVSNYVKHRPGYPEPVLEHLANVCRLNEQSMIADIGSGTGIFSKLLLDKGYTVYGVEPNEAMRKAAEKALNSCSKFKSVDGSAETTTLPPKSTDAIICAQAFHWFNNAETKAEFDRILKPKAKAALIWNNRSLDADAFAVAYELLLEQQSNDYTRVNHQNLTATDFVNFFKNGKYELVKFDNVQVLDEEGIIGRAFSSSYVPAEDTAEGVQFLADLKVIFQQYQLKGHVKVHYKTEVYTGGV